MKKKKINKISVFASFWYSKHILKYSDVYSII